MYRIAINGYGRIGQAVLRALYESKDKWGMQVVAINSLSDIETLTYMTRYDTTHGRFPVCVEHRDGNLIVDGDVIRVSNTENPADLDWQDLEIDLILECSGTFGDLAQAQRYLDAGAKRLLFSQPALPEVEATVVYGVNDEVLNNKQRIVSAASCTTNCIVPVLKALDQKWGVENGMTTTIHSAMNDQPIIDSSNARNLRLSRGGLQSIIPIDTSLARGIERMLPHLQGKFDCLHIRVPTQNVSVLDVSLNMKNDVSVEEVNGLFADLSRGTLSHILGYTEEPHASVDFNHSPLSCVVDGSQTKVNSRRMLKLFCWFDNEWGFANRMLDVSRHWLSL